MFGLYGRYFYLRLCAVFLKFMLLVTLILATILMAAFSDDIISSQHVVLAIAMLLTHVLQQLLPLVGGLSFVLTCNYFFKTNEYIAVKSLGLSRFRMCCWVGVWALCMLCLSGLLHFFASRIQQHLLASPIQAFYQPIMRKLSNPYAISQLGDGYMMTSFQPSQQKLDKILIVHHPPNSLQYTIWFAKQAAFSASQDLQLKQGTLYQFGQQENNFKTLVFQTFNLHTPLQKNRFSRQFRKLINLSTDQSSKTVHQRNIQQVSWHCMVVLMVVFGFLMRLKYHRRFSAQEVLPTVIIFLIYFTLMYVSFYYSAGQPVNITWIMMLTPHLLMTVLSLIMAFKTRRSV